MCTCVIWTFLYLFCEHTILSNNPCLWPKCVIVLYDVAKNFCSKKLDRGSEREREKIKTYIF